MGTDANALAEELSRLRAREREPSVDTAEQAAIAKRKGQLKDLLQYQSRQDLMGELGPTLAANHNPNPNPNSTPATPPSEPLGSGALASTAAAAGSQVR